MLEALDSTISTNEQNIYLPQCIYIYILVYALSFIWTSKYFLFWCMIHYILKWASKHLMKKLVRDILMCSIHEHISAGSVCKQRMVAVIALLIYHEWVCMFLQISQICKISQSFTNPFKNAISKLQRDVCCIQVHSLFWWNSRGWMKFFGKLDDISIQQQATTIQHDVWQLNNADKIENSR